MPSVHTRPVPGLVPLLWTLRTSPVEEKGRDSVLHRWFAYKRRDAQDGLWYALEERWVFLR